MKRTLIDNVGPIERAIKIPPKTTNPHRRFKYPLLWMKKGESFLTSAYNPEECRIVARRINQAICNYYARKRLKHTIRFTIRTVPNGVRCWRIT